MPITSQPVLLGAATFQNTSGLRALEPGFLRQARASGDNGQPDELALVLARAPHPDCREDSPPLRTR
eukprot:11173602-Alexandrium_andersonii.AAC.1